MKYKIGVLGLGYVGLPLAVSFSKKFKTIGFDIKKSRIEQINKKIDITNELTYADLANAFEDGFEVSSNLNKIKSCNVYIVTVPTPIDKDNHPDLKLLIKASELISSVLKKGDVVIYESTVYPGATEEICVPILQKSNLLLNHDFYVGFSPERINPGDKVHTFENIDKVVSGSNEFALNVISNLYKEVVKAQIHPVSSIKVAEASKIIENTQRDINIAFVNELSHIFKKMDIDTTEVLNAASTKWNFLNFKPGLVGGHCIGVDPYYLTYKAQAIGYIPEIILAGRRINDSMGQYVVSQLIKAMIKKRILICGAKVLIMGLTFKENCPDIRNTRIVDMIHELKDMDVNVDVYDPWVDRIEALNELNVNLLKQPTENTYDAIIIAVRHELFIKMGAGEVRKLGREPHVLFDLKYIFAEEESDFRL